jgi:dipeptidyl aminopeptidase/acylaminoacyl peptidase
VSYRLPPENVARVLETHPDPALLWSPDAAWAVLGFRDPLPDLSDLTRTMLPLAGMRIDPIGNCGFQIDFYCGLKLRDRSGKQLVTIRLPNPHQEQFSRIGFVSWSHRSDAFVFSRHTPTGTELWYVRCDEPNRPVRLTDRLHTVLLGIDWMPDGTGILCGTIPNDRPEPPLPSSVPAGPNIQLAEGHKSPARTYQDLLKNSDDEALFEYYATSRITIVRPGCPPQYVGPPGLFSLVSVSPDGDSLLTVRLQKPFSLALPLDFFPRKIEILRSDGSVLMKLADIPLCDNIPIEGVRTGPRAVRWWPGYPARLLWTEALDGGDPNRKVDLREQLYFQDAPFNKSATPLLQLKGRYSGTTFFRDPKQWMTTQYDRDRRWTTSTMHRLISDGEPTNPPRLESQVFFDRSIRDRYGDPGRILLEPDAAGFSVAKQIQNQVLLAGIGASPEGNRPFLDLKSLGDLETKRLWRCSQDRSENVVTVLNSDSNLTLLTRCESSREPPNYFLRSLDSPSTEPLTDFVDQNPEIRGITKQLVRYQRPDGVPLSATLYLPANYQPGTRLPLVLWAYPMEFNDPDTAGQVSGNPNSFLRIAGSSHLALLLQGYAIMDDAAMPVIGDPETMNNTFIEQIVQSAHAAIDHAVALGVADPDRVAIGGHSYGAFMTANVLAHSQRFKAGIARSGAYNRTLTPFGFQSERRPLWEAKSVYVEISPLMHADQIKTPMLLIHGEMDNNPGTFPLQSQRMFQAIQGNGGLAKLVMLPYEGHGYRARQSVMHVQHEMVQWLDRYLKVSQNT